MTSLDLLASLAVFTLVFLYSRRRPSLGLPLPPGPRKLPLIGNLLDMPTSSKSETFVKWGKQYGSDIISVSVLGKSMIIANTLDVAHDLMEKRSSIYSSRQHFPMMNELMGWSYMLFLIPYGSYWRAHRRLFHQEFHPAATLRYRPHELRATQELLRRLLDNPDAFMGHLYHMGGSTIMSIAYGIDVLPSNDPYIEMGNQAVETIASAGVPGAFLVDLIPLMKYVPAWLPGAGFQRKAKEGRKLATTMFEKPFEVAKRNIESGAFTPSFTSYCLEKVDRDGNIDYQERVIKGTAAMMYLGGSDTTAASVATFFLAMLANPESQLKAQRELDSVLGHDRLPDFDDEPSLPFVTAIVKEVLRWKAIVPLGAPHLSTSEDVYEGYRIPAGSVIIANVSAMLHDENTYPDPFSFKPERFLKDGKLNPDIQDPAMVAFGFGRRICPGRHMAFSSVWIAISSILAAFDITKATDDNGSVIEPSYEYLSSMLSHPAPFKCSIKPRSSKAENLVRATTKLRTL